MKRTVLTEGKRLERLSDSDPRSELQSWISNTRSVYAVLAAQEYTHIASTGLTTFWFNALSILIRKCL